MKLTTKEKKRAAKLERAELRKESRELAKTGATQAKVHAALAKHHGGLATKFAADAKRLRGMKAPRRAAIRQISSAWMQRVNADVREHRKYLSERLIERAPAKAAKKKAGRK